MSYNFIDFYYEQLYVFDLELLKSIESKSDDLMMISFGHSAYYHAVHFIDTLIHSERLNLNFAEFLIQENQGHWIFKDCDPLNVGTIIEKLRSTHQSTFPTLVNANLARFMISSILQRWIEVHS